MFDILLVLEMVNLPCDSRCHLSQALLPLNGPGFEEQRAHMLIGVIVRAKSKRVFDHTTGNWKVVSGQTLPSQKVIGKYGGQGKGGLTHTTFISARSLLVVIHPAPEASFLP